MKLRDIQKEALDAALSSFRGGGTYHLIQAPVAFGKTILSSALIQEAVIKYGVNCLFLAHLKELVLQTEEKLKLVAPNIDCGVWCGSLDRKENKQVTIGTRQSIVRALKRLDDVSLIIIDEVHVMGVNDDYSIIINHFLKRNPRLRVLGVTGTPFRLGDGYIYGDDKLFKNVAHQTTMDEMIERGYLSPYRYKMAKAPDFSGIKKSGGEFNLGDLGDEMQKEFHMGSVKQVIDEHAENRKSVMIFAVTIEHAESLADFLGCNAVHSKLNDDLWRERVDRFKSGEDRMIVNVSQLSIGFDAPDIDCVILARPTMSAALYTQMIGRGLRLGDKEDCLILDLVGNYLRHGLPSNPKVRTKKEREPSSSGEGEPSVCPNCFEVTSAEICPACGEEIVKVVTVEEVEMKEVETREKFKLERLWAKPNHTTRMGNTGTLFCAKIHGIEKPVFKFCGHGTKSEQFELYRLHGWQLVANNVRRQMGPEDGYFIESTRYGDWIRKENEHHHKEKLKKLYSEFGREYKISEGGLVSSNASS
jgi:DNA repair protein RadD